MQIGIIKKGSAYHGIFCTNNYKNFWKTLKTFNYAGVVKSERYVPQKSWKIVF